MSTPHPPRSLGEPNATAVANPSIVNLPEFAHLTDNITAGSDELSMIQAPDFPWYHFAFEQELLRSSVYSRNLHRATSLSTMTSTVTAHTCSVLAHLSLADVSIASVLRLPVKIEALTNASLYNERFATFVSEAISARPDHPRRASVLRKPSPTKVVGTATITASDLTFGINIFNLEPLRYRVANENIPGRDWRSLVNPGGGNTFVGGVRRAIAASPSSTTTTAITSSSFAVATALSTYSRPTTYGQNVTGSRAQYRLEHGFSPYYGGPATDVKRASSTWAHWQANYVNETTSGLSSASRRDNRSFWPSQSE
jgi:hypothetical protein